MALYQVSHNSNAPRKVLIPGPVEFDAEVLSSMSHASEPHASQDFANSFGEALRMSRDVFQTSNPMSQPFVVSGSGTLGMDMVAAGLIEPSDRVLVLCSGTFGENFARCVKAYGADLTVIDARPGEGFGADEIDQLLSEDDHGYTLIVVTHVETSTGVRNDVAGIAERIRCLSPSTLFIVDAVCSLGVEELRFDDWDLDVVISCSQKGLGCPTGLSISMLGHRAMHKLQARTTIIPGFYSSYLNWLPIMQSYEAKSPVRYFATPPTQLIRALHTALSQILSMPLSERFVAHRATSQTVKLRLEALGLRQLAAKPKYQSNALTAVYVPEGVDAKLLLNEMMQKGFYIASGIHRELGSSYVRLGHMGVSVLDPRRTEIDDGLDALEQVLMNAKARSMSRQSSHGAVERRHEPMARL